MRERDEVRMGRDQVGCSVIIWVGFTANGKSEIGWVPTKMNSKMYCELLKTLTNECAEELSGDEFIFQQNSAAIRISKKVKESFEEKRYKSLGHQYVAQISTPHRICWESLLVRYTQIESMSRKRNKRGIESHIAKRTQKVH